MRLEGPGTPEEFSSYVTAEFGMGAGSVHASALAVLPPQALHQLGTEKPNTAVGSHSSVQGWRPWLAERTGLGEQLCSGWCGPRTHRKPGRRPGHQAAVSGGGREGCGARSQPGDRSTSTGLLVNPACSPASPVGSPHGGQQSQKEEDGRSPAAWGQSPGGPRPSCLLCAHSPSPARLPLKGSGLDSWGPGASVLLLPAPAPLTLGCYIVFIAL